MPHCMGTRGELTKQAMVPVSNSLSERNGPAALMNSHLVIPVQAATPTTSVCLAAWEQEVN